MIPAAFDVIDEAVLAALGHVGFAEGLTLEFKLALPGRPMKTRRNPRRCPSWRTVRVAISSMGAGGGGRCGGVPAGSSEDVIEHDANMTGFDPGPVRAAARRALDPIQPANAQTTAPIDFFFSAKRLVPSDALPPYYLVRFLLVDLLRFRNTGPFDKVAWSVPIDLDGRPFLIEHRKFGVGVFGGDTPADLEGAKTIARLLHRGVKASKRYFTWLADGAGRASALNVVNRAPSLFGRFVFFADLYDARSAEAETRKKESIRTDTGPNSWTVHWPARELREEAEHFALSAIESFFSWTEHVFILIAILRGACATGDAVRDLARADWETKFRSALDVTVPSDKAFFDKLLEVRRQVRNFVAHGSFGKDGEAFSFHSSAGAVPLRILDQKGGARFGLGAGAAYRNQQTLQLLRDFVAHLWSGDREPAQLYIMDYGHPLILTYAHDGQYAQAMASFDRMEALADRLAHAFDRHANMEY